MLNSSFHSKILRQASSLEEYKLYKAALEYDIIDPIIIEGRGDIQSEKKWHDRIEPYHHQITNLITFCKRLPVTLLSDDVGLGKTISAGLIASELFWRGRISKLLIVCPKILREQWKDELEKKFDIESKIVTGKELIEACKSEDKVAIITTYNTARMYLDQVEQGEFDMLILDEAHKLRNLYGVEKTPEMAKRFYDALKKRLFKYVLMLTATPIQNRLWDLYSLIDLLTVARGHENPFGKPESFAKKFIADSRTSARQLKKEMQEEFRSIVYGYISRVRRNDANLQFPERIVQSNMVSQLPGEMEFINIAVECIKQVKHILIQILLFQLLVSSPEALEITVTKMKKRGTIDEELADGIKLALDKFLKTADNHTTLPLQIASDEVSILQNSKPKTAKMHGLLTLISKLRSEKPKQWRVVVFTRWRETQTAIAEFLEQENISYGIINGDSGSRNQETITKFKKEVPEINIIVSTEAGSEGVNLQVANVLVNYDLPWNPMIIEQRIGRIQRLASQHAKVCIFNIVLKDTFEEYIISRLMEKLQMASHAIGDIESLLETSGISDDEDGEEYTSFEKYIRNLVIASLEGQNMQEALYKAEKSISDAKAELEREEKNINSLLGDMGDSLDLEPVSPKLSKGPKSMNYEMFTLKAMHNLGGQVESLQNGTYIIKSENDKKICFDKNHEGTLYMPGTTIFESLVSKIANNSLHHVEDDEDNLLQQSENIVHKWVGDFGAKFDKIDVQESSRCFDGKAMMRVRATVAHDSYERIIEIECSPANHIGSFPGTNGIDAIQNFIDDPGQIGISTEKLCDFASKDKDISEFCRFYLERREKEINSAGNDLRKKKKLEDEFTPRLEISLVGLEGRVFRTLKLLVSYSFDNSQDYQSIITVTPSTGDINLPEMKICLLTNKIVPNDCLAECSISKKMALKHLLAKSEISNRLALSEYTTRCSLSNKLALIDEVEKSAVSHILISKSLLKTSAISGKKAEPEYFTKCDFTDFDILKNEAKTSQVSGKQYRIDEELKSLISGKNGHKNEFILCSETKQPLLEGEAVKSIHGKFCVPDETKMCSWSEKFYHPDDLKRCSLTGLRMYSRHLTTSEPFCLETLFDLLQQTNHKNDKLEMWSQIVNKIESGLKSGKCTIKAAALSPTGNNITIFIESKAWIGLKVRHIGSIYSLRDSCLVGHAAIGKFENRKWNLISN